MKNLKLIEHPALQHKLGFLRDKNTSSSEFRAIIKEVGRFLAYAATADLKTTVANIETPIGPATAQRITDIPIAVSIMRAGNGMLDAILTALPFAQAGHIGIYRDKFINNTVEYFFKLPENVKGRRILLIDPLIATGDTVIASVDRLKQYEVGEIHVLSVLASKPGLEAVFSAHLDVFIHTIGVEEKLNDKGYLVPGLGDAGDRLYNIGGDSQ